MEGTRCRETLVQGGLILEGLPHRQGSVNDSRERSNLCLPPSTSGAAGVDISYPVIVIVFAVQFACTTMEKHPFDL
jgi:hypothetical protein